MCANTARNAPLNNGLKVLAVFGSPNSDGTTAKLLNSLLASLPENAEVDRYDCYKNSPAPCNDCRYCHYADGCAYPDLDNFYQNLENSDVLVFATPVYNLSFPAPLKALIDRMQRYWAARFIRGVRKPIKLKKQAFLITSCGSDSQKEGEMLEKQLKPVLTILNATLTESIHCAGADYNRPIEDCIKAAAKAAERLSQQ